MVRCSDWQYYVCKHSKHISCDSLFNELLAAKFLNLWNIYALIPSSVTVSENHLPDNLISSKLQPASLKHKLIGFPFIKDQKDVTMLDNGFAHNQTDRRKIMNKDALFRIAFFDLWLGNDDRNWNNYNLLLESKADGYYFIPIDHETIFNTNSLHHEITIQTEEDSLIHTPLFKSVISRRMIKNIFEQEKIIREDFYLCIAKCKKQLDKILEEIPHDWNISIDTKRELILKNVFSSKRADEVFHYFLIYLKQLL